MHGLPDKIDLSFFVDQELQQVCIGVNDLILRFDEPTFISITSGCSYETGAGVLTKIDDYRSNATLICGLLGNKIVGAKGDETGTLSLRFENGDAFMIYDDNEHYESYWIKSPGGDIVV